MRTIMIKKSNCVEEKIRRNLKVGHYTGLDAKECIEVLKLAR